ncbi:imelysin family protein [Vogesella indigofera]|uniref:imelysin family protein n=1 Tax=Vogesella indigofera TaxID=45465 RepID=UPI00234ED665|nr:imelysin family protein [Vogesella indigofera]MDC7712430.1 imelysin family protein [Vogesella indigofera]
MQLKSVLTLSALLLAGAAHADTAAPRDATSRYVQYVLNDTLLPRYRQLAAANRALASQLQQSCARPDDAGLAAVRQQWQQAYGSWMRVAALNWGPTAQLRSQRTIAFKPTRTALVDSAVSRSAALEADVFYTTGTAAKGYTAIEYLLYRPVASLATPGVCAWLQRNADDIGEHSAELQRQWQRFAARIAAGENADDLPSSQQALEEIINLTLAGNNELHKELSRLSSQKPELVSGQRSHSGKRLLQAQFDLLQQLLVGGNGKDFALAQLLKQAQQPALAQQLRQRVAAVGKGLAQLPDNLVQVGRSGKEKAAVQALAALLTLLEGPVADSLDITLSFNESDGD